MAKRSYNAASIVTLTDCEGVRKNPAIFAGDDEKTAAFLTVKEIIDNARDEAVAGKSKQVTVVRFANKFAIYDDGRGIPTEIHPTQKISTLELVFTKLNAGAKGNNNSYGDTGDKVIGVHGMGAAVSNALCDTLDVFTYRKGWFRYSAAQGKSIYIGKAKHPTSDALPPAALDFIFAKAQHKGTLVIIKPDQKIFEGIEISSDAIENYMRMNSLFIPGIEFKFLDLTNPEHKPGIYFNRTPNAAKLAIESLIQEGLDRDKIQSKVFTHNSAFLECAFCITDTDREMSTSVCASPTQDRGTHWQGFLVAVEKAIAPFIKKNQSFNIEDFAIGFSGFLNYNISPPSFSGQAKAKLKSKGAVKHVADLLTAPLTEFFKSNAKVVRDQIERAVRLKTLENKYQDERNLEKKVGGKSFPLRFASSPYAKPAQRELYLLEGTSAAGPAKRARDEKFQEVLPIDGKILNVYRQWKRAATSEAVQNILRVIGYSKDDPKMLKSRVQGKIIILADADNDGSHVRILVIALLWRFFPEAFRRGMVYYADTPIYSHRSPAGAVFGNSLSELKTAVQTQGQKYDAKNVSRAKGWAEVSKDQIKNFAFDVNKRKLIKIPAFDAPEDFAAFKGIIMDVDATYRADTIGLPRDVLDSRSSDEDDGDGVED